jgi:sulfur carrier protein
MTGMTAVAIEVNGEREPLSAATLSALLEGKGIDLDGRGVAVAVNGAVVPRAAWRLTALRAGDAVEIVRAKQGG